MWLAVDSSPGYMYTDLTSPKWYETHSRGFTADHIPPTYKLWS